MTTQGWIFGQANGQCLPAFSFLTNTRHLQDCWQNANVFEFGADPAAEMVAANYKELL